VTFPIVMWHVSDLLVGPGNPGRLYALQRSDVYTPSHVDNPPMRLLFSDDFGTTWQPFAGGLPTGDNACLHTLTMDYAGADALYATTCNGIYRWSNNTWTRFSQQSVGALAITYGKPNVMYATGYAPSSLVLKSDNGGATWQAFDADLVSFSGLANLGIDPRNGATLYGMINPKYAGSYLRRADSGGHWVTMPVPPTGYTSIGFTIDGATGALYVAVQGNTVWELWRTLNPSEPDLAQIRWEKVGDFGPESAGNLAYLISSGASPQGLALFARIDSANCNPVQGVPCISLLRRSTDLGHTWTTLPLPTR